MVIVWVVIVWWCVGGDSVGGDSVWCVGGDSVGGDNLSLYQPKCSLTHELSSKLLFYYHPKVRREPAQQERVTYLPPYRPVVIKCV